uniref:Uncharacterized protein n=1 Tax=Ditylenchus dipsaci TaxID=166011 RepID=A0A915DIN2_9BILA
MYSQQIIMLSCLLLLAFYLNLAQMSVSAEYLPTVLVKRTWKYDKKDAPIAYSDEMFNFDTLAGIGLGKRSGRRSIASYMMQRAKEERDMQGLQNQQFMDNRLRRSSPSMVVLQPFYSNSDMAPSINYDPLVGLPSSIRNQLIAKIYQNQAETSLTDSSSPDLSAKETEKMPGKRFYVSQLGRVVQLANHPSGHSMYDQLPGQWLRGLRLANKNPQNTLF